MVMIILGDLRVFIPLFWRFSVFLCPNSASSFIRYILRFIGLEINEEALPFFHDRNFLRGLISGERVGPGSVEELLAARQWLEL